MFLEAKLSTATFSLTLSCGYSAFMWLFEQKVYLKIIARKLQYQSKAYIMCVLPCDFGPHG